MAGLVPDEVAAILKRGEEVLPQNSPRHRNNAGMSNDTNGRTTVVQQTLHFNLPPGGIDKRSQSQIGDITYRGAMRASMRANS